MSHNAKRALCPTGLPVIAMIACACVAGTARGQTFSRPIDDWIITQEYARYGAVVPQHFHTGIDAVKAGLSDPYQEQREVAVSAAHEGIVEAIFGLQIAGTYWMRRWNPDSNAFDWSNAPTSGSNHRFGQCVIVYHEDLNVYTLYAHLDAVRVALNVGESIPHPQYGYVIGRQGNSGQSSQGTDYLRFCKDDGHNHSALCIATADAPPGVDVTSIVVVASGGMRPHLHFEEKYQGVLGDIPDGVNFGYTPYYPDQNYRDPMLAIHPTSPILPEQLVTVTPQGQGVSMRPGPGEEPVVGAIQSGDEYLAGHASEPTVVPGCSHGWLRLQRADGGYIPNPEGGGMPHVWVCAGDGNVVWLDGYDPSAPTIAFSPTSLAQTSNPGQNAPAQTIEVWNAGEGVLDYAITTDAPWLAVSPASGQSTGEVNSHTVFYSSASLPPGDYSAAITVDSLNASNSPQTIPVSLTVLSTSCEPYWDNTIGQPGMNSGVWFSEAYNGDLVAGGEFTTAGNASAKRIARWNEVSGSWQPLDAGMAGEGDPYWSFGVWALAVYDDDLVAGGNFTTAGGVTVNRIARWDLSSWYSLGSGMNDIVTALTVYNGELIAAGHFTFAGGLSANRIARWNEQVWQPLGAGLSHRARSVTVYDGELVVGGWFGSAGGVPGTSGIARWNGSTWQSIGGGVSGGPTYGVAALTVYNGDLIAGGDFTAAGGVAVNHIARWGGLSWYALGDGVNGLVENMTVYNGDLVAGGSFTTAGGISADNVARWDGLSWESLGSGVDSTNWSLGVYHGELIAGGHFTVAGGMPADRIATWRGCGLPCPWDCDDAGADGVVGVTDFLDLLIQWGSIGSTCDIGVGVPGVSVEDFLDLLLHWGPCP